MFDKIVDKIEDTLYDPLSARNHTCSDFNIQPKEWLGHLNKTDEGRYWHDFITYELPQIANHLDIWSWKILHRSVTSLGHSLINVDAMSKVFLDVPFHRTIFWYSKIDWDSFHCRSSSFKLSSLLKVTLRMNKNKNIFV